MRRSIFRPTALAVLAGALALSACSDSIVSPPTRSVASGPSLSAIPGTNSFTIISDASSQYCPTAQVNGVIATFPASFAPIASGCVAARDLQADGSLTAYNPGWDNPTGLTVTTGHWIGFSTATGPSSDYRPNVGEYVYQQTFTLPASITAPSLTLDVIADNVVAVYLNGHHLGEQTMVDCNTAPCHWSIAGKLTVTDNNAADFNINALNTLTFIVVDVPTGYPITVGPTGGPAPQYACPTRLYQANGTVGFTATLVPTAPAHVIAGGGAGTAMTNIGAANQAGCENPSGVAFAGTVSWTPPPPPPICDFITFGRLVLDVGDDKIVISGNAGGNAPGGGILGTIEVSVGGTQYHVPTIESYGPTTSGVLFPDQFARVITGHSDGHLVELRLRDNPNPGQGEPGTDEGDKIWLKIDNNVVVPLQTLDRGNIQLHLHCRGPGE